MAVKVIEFDADLDSRLESALPDYFRGQRKVRIRVEHVVSEWLKQNSNGNRPSIPPESEGERAAPATRTPAGAPAPRAEEPT